MKLTVKVREEIKTLILICRARGFNPRQTVAYVNEHLAEVEPEKTISESWIIRTTENMRAESNEWLRNLGHGKSDYIAMFRDVIDRLQQTQKELWALVDRKQQTSDRNKEYVCIKAYSEIHSINKTLWQLYKDIPLLMPGSAKTIDNIVFEDTTGVYPEIST
jgi:hypothetical protein